MNPSQSALLDDTIESLSASKRVQRRAAIASVIGTTIEWYDFFIYGTAAALVFPSLFFSYGGSDGLMESFATIFVGFLSRPLGGALFGHLGDRVGRKSTLVATLTLMGVATVLVGCLPTEKVVGPAAGWLLIGLRFLQGIGVGGEWGGAVLLSMESHHGKRRSFMASLPNVGVPLGLVISVLVWSACSHLAGSALLENGWRLPFIASAVLLMFGLLIRVGVPETRDFIEANRSADRTKSPLGEAIRTEWRAILLSALIRPGEQAAFYTLTTFAVLYGSKHLALGRDLMLNAVLIAALVACFALPFFGYVADRIGRRRTYMSAAICMMLFAFPYFALLNTRLPLAVIGGTVFVMVIHAALYGSQAAYIAESFPAHIRYSGASLGYQGASIIAGGPAPLVSLWLFQTFHSGYAVAAYLAAMSLVSICASFFLGRPKPAAVPDGLRTNV
ncbi:MFS transporter [Caballeronia sordidicola]|uniref:Permeases of the major facilitator superfamily n=2 Tax=Burkholderiaceae TaxID=119060 RepID=A0A242M374_CABSO|nr:MFS transporter [Caballeronia sordidicola]AME27001.1 MFS transporter [Burkholderia sp. PAMC 26561]AME27853.1 MFS transporter [Burkholderia sp. PAMC 26561]OTP65605.1 Permeases of the major facilitator superfamily [Caballeronia sordidicola]